MADVSRIELPVTYTASWRRRLTGFLISLGFVAGGYVLTLIPDSESRRGDPDLVGWPTMVFGAVCALGFAHRLVRAASLTLTADGLHDDTSPTAAGFVPWSAVRES